VNKTDVSAPALIAFDLLCLGGARRRLPEDLELHIHLSQIRHWLSHFASPNSTVKIDHRGGFSRGARHAPPAAFLEICELSPMMERQRTDVGHPL